MDFKAATDALFARVTHDALAEQLGVSVPAIRQARLDAKAAAHRNPPEGWESAALVLSEARIKELQELVRKLKAQPRRPTRDAQAAPSRPGNVGH